MTALRKRQGFSLIELLVTISIIAIITIIGFSMFSQAQMRGRDSKRKQDLRAIELALDTFYYQNKRYPCAVATGWNQWSLSRDSVNWITDSGSCTGGSNISFQPTYINKLPMDPLTNNSSPLLGGGTGYGYAYWSGNSGGAGACGSFNGGGFTLVARLENVNDSETIQKAGTKTCDGVTTYYPGLAAFYRPENFIIAK